MEFLTFSDDEEQRDGIKIYPCPKVGITRAIYSCCGYEGTSETPRRDDTSDRPRPCKDAFIPEVFSFIGNAAHVLLNKIITLNEKLRTCGDAMSRKSEAREGAPPRDDRQSISGYHDPSASLQCTLGSQQAASKSKCDSRDTNLSSRMSMGEGSREEIREIRHSIIEDRRNDAKYLLTSTSGCNCDLGRPYKVRRSLLIRSRLRDSASPQDQSPFCLIKRARTKMPEDDEAKGEADVGRAIGRGASVLKDSEKFWTLPEVNGARGNDSDVSETREHGDEAKKRISRERSHDDTASGDVSAEAQERKLTDNSAVELADELVTSVHDYFRLQTEINTNVYSFITSEIDTVRKTHGERS